MKKAATLCVAVLALTAVAAAGARTARVVSTTHNAKLGKTILVTTRGLTLYSLSVERHGRFIAGLVPVGSPAYDSITSPLDGEPPNSMSVRAREDSFSPSS